MVPPSPTPGKPFKKIEDITAAADEVKKKTGIPALLEGAIQEMGAQMLQGTDAQPQPAISVAMLRASKSADPVVRFLLREVIKQSEALRDIYEHLYTLQSAAMTYRPPAVAVVLRRQLDDARLFLADAFLLLFGNHFSSAEMTNNFDPTQRTISWWMFCRKLTAHFRSYHDVVLMDNGRHAMFQIKSVLADLHDEVLFDLDAEIPARAPKRPAVVLVTGPSHRIRCEFFQKNYVCDFLLSEGRPRSLSQDKFFERQLRFYIPAFVWAFNRLKKALESDGENLKRASRTCREFKKELEVRLAKREGMQSGGDAPSESTVPSGGPAPSGSTAPSPGEAKSQKDKGGATSPIDLSDDFLEDISKTSCPTYLVGTALELRRTPLWNKLLRSFNSHTWRYKDESAEEKATTDGWMRDKKPGTEFEADVKADTDASGGFSGRVEEDEFSQGMSSQGGYPSQASYVLPPGGYPQGGAQVGFQQQMGILPQGSHQPTVAQGSHPPQILAGSYSQMGAQSGYQQPLGAQAGYQQLWGAPAGYQQPMIPQGGYQQPGAQAGYQHPLGAQTVYQPLVAQTGYQQPMVVQGGYQHPLGAQTGYQQPLVAQTGYQQPMVVQGGYQPIPSQMGAPGVMPQAQAAPFMPGAVQYAGRQWQAGQGLARVIQQPGDGDESIVLGKKRAFDDLDDPNAPLDEGFTSTASYFDPFNCSPKMTKVDLKPEAIPDPDDKEATAIYDLVQEVKNSYAEVFKHLRLQRRHEFKFNVIRKTLNVLLDEDLLDMAISGNSLVRQASIFTVHKNNEDEESVFDALTRAPELIKIVSNETGTPIDPVKIAKAARDSKALTAVLYQNEDYYRRGATDVERMVDNYLEETDNDTKLRYKEQNQPASWESFSERTRKDHHVLMDWLSAFA